MAGESNIGGADFYKMTAEQQAIGAMADRTSAARAAALQTQINELQNTLQAELSKDKQYTALAEQIRALSDVSKKSAQYQGALAALTAQRNMGTGDFANALNFQVSDEQILSDINRGQYSRIQNAIDQGQGIVAFLTDRIASVNNLMQGLPENDARKISSAQLLKELNSDLLAAQSSLAFNQKALSDFKPIEAGSSEANKIVSGFRESIRLPEERALNQIRQIDPGTFDAVQFLGTRLREMAAQDVGSTADPRTEQLRGALEDLAFQELQLGGRLSPEETRAIQQSVRGRQAQLGNVEGMGPFSEEFAALGLASDQRRLGRAQSALGLLASGQTRSDEARRDRAFRDSANLARMGAASDFVASGPSAYNLANMRTAQQQAAFNAYVNANQINPGAFSTSANQVPGYMYADPGAPSQMAGQQGSMFGNLYGQQANFASNIFGTQGNIFGSQADYGARTYAAQAQAQAQVAQANALPNYISAFSGLVPSFSFGR